MQHSTGKADISRVRTVMVGLTLGALAVTAIVTMPVAGASNRATTILGVHHTSLGNVVATSNGITLYLFEADTTKKSACGGGCTAVWSPLIAHGQPKATGVAKISLLGTIKRSTGAKQLTYAGHPLYTYIGDTTPGSVTGEGKHCFGGGWDALTPAGKKIEKSGS